MDNKYLDQPSRWPIKFLNATALRRAGTYAFDRNEAVNGGMLRNFWMQPIFPLGWTIVDVVETFIFS